MFSIYFSRRCILGKHRLFEDVTILLIVKDRKKSSREGKESDTHMQISGGNVIAANRTPRMVLML